MTATMEMKTAANEINGINVGALRGAADAIRADAKAGQTRWAVQSKWAGGTRSDHVIDGCHIGGQKIDRRFKLHVDEPLELCGTNAHANPQEYLLAALNACMMVGYVAGAALDGIELESLDIQSHGDIDLRGFLGLDPSVKAGYEQIHYTVRIKGRGTREQFETLHRRVMATSPNRFNLANPIALSSNLIVE